MNKVLIIDVLKESIFQSENAIYSYIDDFDIEFNLHKVECINDCLDIIKTQRKFLVDIINEINNLHPDKQNIYILGYKILKLTNIMLESIMYLSTSDDSNREVNYH